MFLFKKQRKLKELDVQTDPSSATSDMIKRSFTHNLNDAILTSQSNLLLQDFRDSLETSKITMLPNHDINPSGQEHGNFLCIDLGGSTLRVAVVEILKPESEVRENAAPECVASKPLEIILTNNSSESKLNLSTLNDHTDSSIDTDFDKNVNKNLLDPASRVRIVVEKKWTIENTNKNMSLQFFRFIGSKIAEILHEQELIDISAVIPTGITWSFPLETTSHNTGRIVHVSKGYTISEEIYNKDLKTLLESVLREEFNIGIDIRSVVNDSLAVYSAGVFLEKYTKLAMVLGTGFNCCCALESETLPHHKVIVGPKKSSKVLFNMELSLFGDQMLPYIANKYDYVIDPRFENFQFNYRCFSSTDENGSILQPTELMTSGRYLPELTRLILVDLINEGQLFGKVDKTKLEVLHLPYDGFSGELMCLINESDDEENVIKGLAQGLSINPVFITHEDVVILKDIIKAIIERAAFIVATAVVSIIKLLKTQNTSDEKLMIISYVGSVLTYFHNYRNEIRRFINDNKFVKDAGITVDFKLINNSSIIGAAIGAAYFS